MFPSQYVRPSLLGRSSGLLKSINWAGLLDNTQKTLGVINQAIPIVYQVKPILSNARTMFRIADQMRGTDYNVPSNTNDVSSNRSSTEDVSNKPIFYI